MCKRKEDAKKMSIKKSIVNIIVLKISVKKCKEDKIDNKYPNKLFIKFIV